MSSNHVRGGVHLAENNINNNVNDQGAQMSFDPTRKFVVKRTGKQIARMQNMIKRSAIAAAALLVLVALIYALAVMSLGGRGGDFTVKCDPGSRNMISLSEHSDMSDPTVILHGTQVKDMWNITESWLPEDIDGDFEGAHNGSGMTEDDPSYLAYTFYLKNVMDKEIKYDYYLRIVDAESPEDTDLGIEDAARIKIYRNGEPVVYGKNQPDSDKPLPEAESFEDNKARKIINVSDNGIEANAVDKYTVVIWLEGEDPECINEILGAYMKVDMVFNTQPDETEA